MKKIIVKSTYHLPANQQRILGYYTCLGLGNYPPFLHFFVKLPPNPVIFGGGDDDVFPDCIFLEIIIFTFIIFFREIAAHLCK